MSMAQTARTLGHKVMEDNGREGLVVCSFARLGFYNGANPRIFGQFAGI